ncbi:MAG: AmmeMemoRadiSam system protein B [Balneolaceae bacterium]
MNSDFIFNSLTEPIPPVRRDLQFIPVKNNDRDLLFFYDSMGYMAPDFALDRKVEPVLALITGDHSIQHIIRQMNGNLSADDLLQFIQLLDSHKALESEHYRLSSEQTEKEFENSEIREAAFAGESYPADPNELSDYISQLVEENSHPSKYPAKALYAPHIDLRVGDAAYGAAFSTLKDLKPKRVIILATAHYPAYYGNYYENFPFIGTSKNFKIPGRELETDREIIRMLDNPDTPNGFTVRDRAHRVEHSIELHLIFLSYLWKHDFKIIPVLVSGFEELYYHDQGDLSEKIDSFASQIKSLDDGNTFFLISGDLSHVGKKFGDILPAEELRADVEAMDLRFIEKAEQGNPQQLLQLIGDDYDSTRICGFPPLYTFLKAFPETEGKQINYSWWDEKERESAVSFGAVRY